MFFSHSFSPSLCHSVSPSISRFPSKENKKTTAAIVTESQERPGPGLSPLESPDWSRPTVWALLPCGRRGRQFSERCRGRRAISAVLSGQIYTAGSKLIFFTAVTHFVFGTGNLSVRVYIYLGDRHQESADYLLTNEMSVRFFKIEKNQTNFCFSHSESNAMTALL